MSEFDKIFKDKLYNREVPFNQNAWQRAEAMIDASERTVFWTARRIAAAVVILFSSAAIASYFTIDSLSEGQYEKKNYTQQSNSSRIYEGVIWPVFKSETTSDAASESGISDLSASASESASADNATRNNETSSTSTSVVHAGSHPTSRLDATEGGNENRSNFSPVGSEESTVDFMDSKMAKALVQKENDELKDSPVVSFESDPSKEVKEPFRHHEFSVELNAGIADEFNTAANEAAQWGASGALGVRYQYNLNENWSLGTGVFYDMRNGSPVDYSVEDIEYGYELRKTNTDYRSLRIHRLTLPVEVGYNIMGKHNVRVGVRTSYIVNTRTEVSSYSTLGQNTNEEETSKEWGYLNGHEPLYFSGSVAYEYMLNPKWGLGCKAIFGLSDVTDNAHFQNNIQDRDTQIQLTLRYRFIEF